MSVHGFSFRQVARPLVLRSLDQHQWEYSPKLLDHMFGNYPVFVEMGGLLGLSFCLRTDTEGGLREDERESDYAQRKELYSTNHLPLPPVKPFMEHVVDALKDPMLIILMIGGAISIAANTARHPDDGWIEGLAILIAVILVTLVSSYNNYSQEVAFLKLASELKGKPVDVIRNKVEVEMEQEDLLVGDIVKLNPGRMIPADGVLIDTVTIRVNESALTGESDELVKSPQSPFLYSGTEVVTGNCHMLITAVGVNSAKGKLMSALAQSQEPTQLQERLEHTAKLVGYIGMTCSIATFLSLLIRYIVDVETTAGMGYSDTWTVIIDYAIISITIIVVAIPEGLPLAVTVSLAYSMAKMRDDQNMVKVLSACETMGNATAICSDKTGTLTQNKMTAVQMYVAGRYFPRQAQADEIPSSVHDRLVDSIVCNSDRRVTEANMDFKVAPEDWKWEGDGGATESALLAWISRYHEEPGQDIMKLRKLNNPRVLQFYPFSSQVKYSSVVMAQQQPPAGMAPEGKDCIVYYKGAADRIIKKCNKMIIGDGSVVPVGSLILPKCQTPNCKREAMRGPWKDTVTLCEEHSGPDMICDCVCRYNKNGVKCSKWAVMGEKGKSPLYCTDPNHHPYGAQLYLLDQHPYKLMTNMTRVGLRCIAFAYKDGQHAVIKDGQLEMKDISDESDWTLIGLAGIKDPLRLETRDAVMTCQQAGIVVRMVTGDNIDTARFIAEDCGIITHPRHRALEGSDFRMALEQNESYKAKNNGDDMPEFVELVKHLRVMARCQPEDKLELVRFLREHGDVVGVTGDGSNDGPALKAADVGLAMGIAGTDVAKHAAKIVILDDNFSSIVKSVMWGRCVYDNIRKFLQFQCSVNFCALVLALVGAISDGKEPLKPVQLLWVNLIMDTMGALALGTESPKPVLLQRRPYAPEGPLISKIMWRNIIGQGLVQLAVLFTILYAGKDWFDGRFYRPDGQYWEEKHFTLIFNAFVWLQFFNEINSRKVNCEYNIMESFFDNAWFSGVLIITAGFQILMVEVFGSFAKTVPQEWDLWLVAIAFGFTQIVSGMLLRFWQPDPTEGQIDIPASTFENAAWIDNPKLVGALFNNYRAKSKAEAGKGSEGIEDGTALLRVAQEFYESPPGTQGALVKAYGSERSATDASTSSPGASSSSGATNEDEQKDPSEGVVTFRLA